MPENVKMIAQYGDVLMYLLTVERKNRGGDVDWPTKTQGAVGAGAGLSPSTWGRLEKGEGGILVDYIANASIEFGYSMRDMVNAADTLCAVLEESGLYVRGYGYKNHRILQNQDGIATATFEEIQKAYTKTKLGRAFVVGVSKFGGVIRTLLTYAESPEQFNSFVRLDPLLRDASEASFKL